MKKVFFSILLMLSLTLPAQAEKHLHLEKVYQNAWCNANNGQTEVPMPDGSRADCVTDKYAIEFDFAHKYQESIGQSEEYSMQTGKQAGIVLILESMKDNEYLNRLLPIAQKYDIRVWTMTPSQISHPEIVK